MTFDGRLLSGISALAAVVEAGSFVRAADSLGLTQSGVSRAVARLEARLGVRLFDRTPRAITLTEEGRRFYDGVMPHLTGIEERAAEASGGATAVRGRLRVNADAAFGHSVLAPRLAGFMARHPEIELELVVRDRIGDLVAEGFDIALRFGEPEPSGLNSKLLLESRVLTCASPDYVARRGRPQHPDNLIRDGHECVLVKEAATGRPYEWEFRRKAEVLSVPVRGRLTVNDSGSLIGALLGGQGIGQPLEFSVRDLLASGRLVRLLPDWSDERFPVYAYHRSRGLPSARVRAFLDFVFEITV
jgi:DNA-binding transcriptional LysR family regulator